MSDNQNNNPKGIIIGMLCLIWGLGSIAAMLFCSKLENHTGILLVLLGQFFLVIGLIAVICNRKAKPYPFIVLVFPLVGIALLVCGICILTKGEVVLSMLNQYAPYILIWIFPLAGIMMIAGTLGKIRYLKQVCTQEVQAKCVDIESASAAGTHRRKHVTMPVYSISYNGEEKLLRKGMYTNLNHFEIGAYYNIRINPSNPDEYLDENNRKGNNLILILGVVLLVVTLPVIVYMYINGI